MAPHPVGGRCLVRDARRCDVLAERGQRVGCQAPFTVPVDQRGDPPLGLQRAQRHRRYGADRAAHPAPGRVEDDRDGCGGAAGAGAAGRLQEDLRGVQQRYADETDQLRGFEHLAAGQQVRDGDLAAGAAGARDDELGLQGGEHRQGVAGRGGGGDVAAERPGVTDLGRARGARGRGQGGDQGGEVGPPHAGVGESGAEQSVTVLVVPAAELADPAEADQSGGTQEPLVDGRHQVRATGHRNGGRHGAERRHGLVERDGQRHGLRRLRCVRGQPSCPFPVSRRPACFAVRYVLEARTWQLWHIFRSDRREGPRRVHLSPTWKMVLFRTFSAQSMNWHSSAMVVRLVPFVR